MTDAEKALLEAALSFDPYDDRSSTLVSARDAVLLERMPEGYERSLRQLTDRYMDAYRAALAHSRLHPMGERMMRDFQKDYCKANP